MSWSKLGHQWNIVVFRARISMRAETSKTYLNFLWWVIDPVFTMAVFYVVFAVVLKRGTEDYPIFLIVGLVVWQWFGNTVISAVPSVHQAGSLINQVRFPKVVLPLTVVLTNTYKFLFVTSILVVLLWALGFTPTDAYLALPLLMLLQLTLIYGACVLVAAMTPLLPDLQYIMNNLLRAMMFMSGVFYPISAIPERFQVFFLFNPMVSIIDAYRQVLMYEQWPSFSNLTYAVFVTAVVAIGGSVLIGALDSRFARLIAQR